MGRRAGRAKTPLSLEEAAAKEERRRRGLQVSTFCLHGMGWVLLTFYATDYLPPLAIRLTVGLSASHQTQYLVGYSVLSVLCLLLGAGFGGLYQPRISTSRFPWRWYLFPTAVALVLIPAQGQSEVLSRLVEAACLLAGVGGGALLARAFRRSPLPSGGGRAAAS